MNKGLWLGVGKETAGALTAGQWSSSFPIAVPSNWNWSVGKESGGGGGTRRERKNLQLGNWENPTSGSTWFHRTFTSYIFSHQPTFIKKIIILNNTKVPIILHPHPSPSAFSCICFTIPYAHICSPTTWKLQASCLFNHKYFSKFLKTKDVLLHNYRTQLSNSGNSALL